MTPYGHEADDLLTALRLDRVDDDEAVGPLVHGAVVGEAGGVVAVLAGLGQVGDLGERVLAALLALDVHPAVPVPGLRGGRGRKVVADELVLVGQKAVVAVVAAGDVDDHVPLLHLASPSHFSTSIRHESLAIAVEVGVMNRLLVRMFTQPALSGDAPGSPSGQVVGARLVGVDGAGRQALGELRAENDRAALVEGAHEVAVGDAARLRVGRGQADQPVRVPVVFEHAVVFDVVDPAVFGVAHGVKAEARVRRDQLQRVVAVELGGVVALPARDELGAHRRPLGVDHVALQASERRAHELDLARRRLQAAPALGVAGRRTPVGGVALAALGEPAHGRRRDVVGGHGHDEVALAARTPPR